MPTNTLLELSGIDLGDYAVRGLQLEIAPIEPGDLERDINGGLHDLTLTAFRKYQLTITCTDQEAPELTDVWRGKPVTVTCLPRALMGVSSGDTAEISAGAVLSGRRLVECAERMGAPDLLATQPAGGLAWRRRCNSISRGPIRGRRTTR